MFHPTMSQNPQHFSYYWRIKGLITRADMDCWSSLLDQLFSKNKVCAGKTHDKTHQTHGEHLCSLSQICQLLFSLLNPLLWNPLHLCQSLLRKPTYFVKKRHIFSIFSRNFCYGLHNMQVTHKVLPFSHSFLLRPGPCRALCVHPLNKGDKYIADPCDRKPPVAFHADGTAALVCSWKEKPVCVSGRQGTRSELVCGSRNKTPDRPDTIWRLCFSSPSRRHTPRPRARRGSDRRAQRWVLSSSASPRRQPAWCSYPERVWAWKSACTEDTHKSPDSHLGPSSLWCSLYNNCVHTEWSQDPSEHPDRWNSWTGRAPGKPQPAPF